MPYSPDSPIAELVALTLLSQLYYFPLFSFTVLNMCYTPGRYFGNWLSDHCPLAHSICSPQARLLAAPNCSFLICHTRTVLLPSPLLLITILPNNQHFLWGSKIYSHGHQSSKMAPWCSFFQSMAHTNTEQQFPSLFMIPPSPDFSYNLDNPLYSGVYSSFVNVLDHNVQHLWENHLSLYTLMSTVVSRSFHYLAKHLHRDV